jgi:para-nitrobenzyl esterase
MKELIETPSGPVQGTAVAGGRALCWRGIPYAAAPIGPLRFRAPAPPAPWGDVRSAVAISPAPVQSASSLFAGGIPGNQLAAVSEDCLTVDIWAPAGGRSGRPVLVWIPGGAFLTGGSAVPTYDGSRLAAEQDVVVVSVNYRLGALGFLWLEDGDSNCGLRDQLAALRWTRDSIAAFGGDPANVTVVAESAGAGSLIHILPAAASEGLLRRAVIQSCGVEQTQSRADTEKVKSAVLATAGVGSERELWSLPWRALLEAQEAAVPGLMATVGAMPFHPAVDGDLVGERPADSWPIGSVDILVSWTAEEMRLYPDRGAEDPDGLRSRLRGLVRRRTGVDTDVTPLLDFYSSCGTGADIWAAAQTDLIMRLPARRLALSVTGSAVHLAQFDWGATGGDWRRGAFHAIDLPFTFGTLDVAGWDSFLGAAGPDDRGAHRLAEFHMEAWAAYARTGDPGWEPAPVTMRFDTDSAAGDDPLVETAAVWRSVVGDSWPPI